MLTNRENHLESDRGYYYADTHQIICVDRVEMRNDKYELKGDSVVYDTDTDQAHFFERTNIWNEGGDYIYADRGRYEKPRELYVLTRNGYVMTEKQELWSDSLDYYRESGHALLFRNIQIDDAEHKVLAFGDYGEYWKEPGNALLTQRPRWSATIRVRAIRSICVPIRCFFIRSRRASRHVPIRWRR